MTHAPASAPSAATATVKLVADLTGAYGTHLAFDHAGKHWALADRRSIQLGSDGVLERKVTSAELIHDLTWSRDDRRLLAGPARYDLELDTWQQTPALSEAMVAGLDDPPALDQLAIVAAGASPDGQELVITTHFQPSRELDAVDRYRGPQERVLLLGADRALRGVLYAGDEEMRTLAVSDHLIAAGGDTVQVWERRTLRKVAELPHRLVARAMAFNAAGDRLAVITAEGEVTLWNPMSGARLGSFQAHQVDGYTVAFHPTLPLLATGGQDGKLRLWSISATSAGTLIYEVFLGGWVQAVAFAPSGTRLAAATRARPPHLVIYELAAPLP